MELKILKPRLSLNKAFLKVKPNRPEIELFKKNLISLIATIDEFESEEFHKNEVSKFLQNTYYSGNHYINRNQESPPLRSSPLSRGHLLDTGCICRLRRFLFMRDAFTVYFHLFVRSYTLSFVKLFHLNMLYYMLLSDLKKYPTFKTFT